MNKETFCNIKVFLINFECILGGAGVDILMLFVSKTFMALDENKKLKTSLCLCQTNAHKLSTKNRTLEPHLALLFLYCSSGKEK